MLWSRVILFDPRNRQYRILTVLLLANFIVFFCFTRPRAIWHYLLVSIICQYTRIHTGLEIKKNFQVALWRPTGEIQQPDANFQSPVCKMKMTQLIGTGLLIFRAGAELRNSQKHTKYREIQQKSYQIHVCTTYLKLISAIGGYLLAVNLDTSSLKRANNVLKLPGVDYVAKIGHQP